MDKPVLNVFDVMAKLKVSKSMAYRVIRDLNRELKQKGYYVVNGRVSSDYFKEKFNLNADEYKEDDPQEIEKKERVIGQKVLMANPNKQDIHQNNEAHSIQSHQHFLSYNPLL